MNLNTLIESAEIQYRQILEDFFASFYDEKSLPSHGIDHHRRVWRNAKELISPESAAPGMASPPFTHKLIITCYLHDIGMSVDPGIRHGRFSRNLCRKFFLLHNIDESHYPDVLEAIELHDNKDYKGTPAVNELLKILSAADDLDAFGFTGIYRYTEIYLTRGIDLAVIGTLIKNNAAGRFENFRKNFGKNEMLLQKHKVKYDIVNEFFTEYNGQVTSYKFNTREPSGYCGVVEILDRLIKSGESPQEFRFDEQFSDDHVISRFFRGLREECYF